MAKESCHTCIYACWDLGQAMLSMSTGFANRPTCANHPDAPGLMRATPVGNICRNYRARPATPEGEVKHIPLGGGLYAYVDAADYEWLSQYCWQVLNGGYAARVEKGKRIYMHREIMPPPEGMIVDHIDGNKGNNCRFNLRCCTRSENRRNSAKRRNTAFRFKGVGYSKNNDKYFARFWFNGRRLWLGLFDEEVEAARAYDHKAVECCGPFARLNLPEEWSPERIRQVYAGAQAQREAVPAKAAQAKTRKGKGKGAGVDRKDGRRRTKDARRRTSREKKARKPEGKKAGRTRRTRDAPRTMKQGKNKKSDAKGTTHPARRVAPQRTTKSARDTRRKQKV